MATLGHYFGTAQELSPGSSGKTPRKTDGYKTVQVNDVSLAYREAGPPDGEPIILMHGHMSDLRSFNRIQDTLAQNGYHVFNYSRRFAWPNTPITDAEVDDWGNHAKDMAAFIEALKLGRKVTLCGNSSGGFISLLVARDRPELVSSLVLEEPPAVPIFFPWGIPPSWFAILRFMIFYPFSFIPLLMYMISLSRVINVIKTEGDDEGGAELFIHMVVGNVFYHELTKERNRWNADNTDYTAAFMKRGPGMPKLTEEEAIVVGEKIPTLCLIGEHTADMGAREATKRLGAIMPGAKTVWIKNASHLAHENNPKQVSQAIMEHMERSVKKTN